MTRATHLRVLFPQSRGVEVRAMRIEAPASQRRMALQTIALGVAGDTTLEVLPSRLAVSQGEKLLGVVVAGLERARGHHPCVSVTTGTELPGVVAIGALGLLVVG